jgi:hypothetical protein
MNLLSLLITGIYLCRKLPDDWLTLIIVAISLVDFLPVVFNFGVKRYVLKLLQVCLSPRQDSIEDFSLNLDYLQVLSQHLSFVKLIIYSVIEG